MKKSASGYIAEARAKNPHCTSDAALGEHLAQLIGRPEPFSQAAIGKAKAGVMSDPLALAVAKALGVDAGEVLMVVRAEREPDGATRAALLNYVKKVLASVPVKAVSAIGALAVVLGLLMPAPGQNLHLAEREGFEPSVR